MHPLSLAGLIECPCGQRGFIEADGWLPELADWRQDARAVGPRLRDVTAVRLITTSGRQQLHTVQRASAASHAAFQVVAHPGVVCAAAAGDLQPTSEQGDFLYSPFIAVVPVASLIDGLNWWVTAFTAYAMQEGGISAVAAALGMGATGGLSGGLSVGV